jgi:methylated-DNA-protein-cysteine methyltransferase-like protein
VHDLGRIIETGNEVKVGYEHIYDVVRCIPRGRVATYGQVAELAGVPGQPRRTGYALSGLPADSGVPWHRVINAQGKISFPPNSSHAKLQRRLLKQEGVKFDSAARIDLSLFRWRPK